MKQFKLSDDIVVVVKKMQEGGHFVIVKQKDSDVKYAHFTPNRWAQFRQSIEQIEENVKSLHSGKAVSYRESIGGGYYVSVTTGFPCIDVRKFFMPIGETDVKPTRQGIAIRMREWSEMKKIMDQINAAYPSLGTALPCYPGDRHSVDMTSYDPRIHRELWHNDNPFVLVNRVRQRKCRGCGHRLDDRYVIAHEEQREFWRNRCRTIVMQKTHYHCNVSCIVPRHPYFRAAEVTTPPSIASRLVDEQVLCCGNVELSFLSYTPENIGWSSASTKTETDTNSTRMEDDT